MKVLEQRPTRLRLAANILNGMEGYDSQETAGTISGGCTGLVGFLPIENSRLITYSKEAELTLSGTVGSERKRTV